MATPIKFLAEKNDALKNDPNSDIARALSEQYRGLQYPIESELCDLENFLEQVHDSYVTVSPNDDESDLKSFGDSRATLEEVVQKLLTIMEETATTSESENFAQDLPLVLLDFF